MKQIVLLRTMKNTPSVVINFKQKVITPRQYQSKLCTFLLRKKEKKTKNNSDREREKWLHKQKKKWTQ